MQRIILWFRNDLRVHDNPVLAWAVKNKRPSAQIVPVFCFDPRFFTKSQPDYLMNRKSGIHRTRFQIESVQDLRNNLQQLGSGLLVSMEQPELFLPKLINPEMDTTVVFSAETCSEERKVEDDLEKAMAGCSFVDVWGNTMVHIDDFP